MLRPLTDVDGVSGNLSAIHFSGSGPTFFATEADVKYRTLHAAVLSVGGPCFYVTELTELLERIYRVF